MILDEPYHRVVRNGDGPTWFVFSEINIPAGLFTHTRCMAPAPGEVHFLNCPDNNWYQRGVPGVASSVRDLIAWARSFPDRRYVGASMGGYAALACGLHDPEGSFCVSGVEHRLLVPWALSPRFIQTCNPEWKNLLDHPDASPHARGVAIYGAEDWVDERFLDDESWSRFPNVVRYAAPCGHSFAHWARDRGFYSRLVLDHFAAACELEAAGLLTKCHNAPLPQQLRA
jgi:pimeloyl-ACP methyl ester carboxylesterase